MQTQKMRKFDELIRKELSLIINQLLPGSFASITAVSVSKDKSFAKVWVASPIDSEINLIKLKELEPELKTSLAKSIVARRIPGLLFVLDKTEAEAQKIEKLIHNIKAENENR